MEQNETRDQQYLRILTSGPRGKEDYEAAKYLSDKGYANALVRISYQRDTYGQILDLVWRGPTADGFDFIETLRTRTDLNQSKVYRKQKTDHVTNYRIPIKVLQPHLINLFYKVIETLIIALVFYLIYIYFGISLK